MRYEYVNIFISVNCLVMTLMSVNIDLVYVITVLRSEPCSTVVILVAITYHGNGLLCRSHKAASVGVTFERSAGGPYHCLIHFFASS